MVRGIAALLLPSLGVGVLAWLSWLVAGDGAVLYALILLPIASVVSLLRYQREIARQDAVVTELSLTAESVVLRSSSGAQRVLPRDTLRVTPCVYRSGGRGVFYLPGVELHSPSQPTIGILVADPGQQWPAPVSECSTTPGYVIEPASWPQLLVAFDLAPSRR